MTDAEAARATSPDDHDDGHGHASAGEPLGPVDVIAWAYALAGALLGLLAVMALFVARGS